MSELNWPRMFARYTEVVAQSEGVDFLYESDWTPDEWQAFVDEGILNVDWLLTDPHRAKERGDALNERIAKFATRVQPGSWAGGG